jgi:hypothetical protein
LADEAFLRRIPYKIFAKGPTIDEFGRIFEMNCTRLGLTFDPVIVEYLQRRYYEPRHIEMRACQPRDLLNHIVDLAAYRNRPPAITRDLLDAACASYFLDSQDAPAGRRPWSPRTLDDAPDDGPDVTRQVERVSAPGRLRQ